MHEFIYWPYDEVSLDINMPGTLVVRTPWMEATTSSLGFDSHELIALSNKLKENNLSGDDIVAVSDFFRHFHEYPLAYILPTKKAASGLDMHGIKDRTILHMSFESLLSTILAEGALGGLDVTIDEKDLLMERLSRRAFEWDVGAAIGFARFENRVHPESLLSVARRYHILELMDNDRGNDVFNNIKNLGEQEFTASVARIVRQNHYVTKYCMLALTPALSLAQKAKPVVDDFIKAERGHDKILEKALFHVGVSPKDIEVRLQTRALMAALYYVAGRNFLAFAMAVDAFERNNFEEIDPIAKLLIDKGFAKAGKFINLHMKINDQGSHDNIARQFLCSMDMCDAEYAEEALRLMEVLSVIMCSITS
jgi:hypothetical protein